MKRLFYLTIIMLSVIISSYSCESGVKTKKEKPFFNEFSEIRVFKTSKGRGTSGSAHFFLIYNTYNTKESIIKTATFYVKSRNGQYVMFEMPLENIKFVLNDKFKTPLIYFDEYETMLRQNKVRENNYRNIYNVQKCNTWYFSVTIYTNEQMLPIDINPVEL